MKRCAVLLSVCALALLGLSAPAAADSSSGMFRATMVADVTFAPGVCAPSNMITTSTGSGTVANYGRVTMVSSHCSAVVFSGQSVLTFANGDQLFMRYQGTGPFDPNDPPAHERMTGTWSITGGTGMFAHATGEGSWVGSMRVASWPPLTAWHLVQMNSGTIDL